LLGTLPEAEQTALEEALLRDRDQFEQAWEIENELVDAYVRNELSAIERQQFEQHYLASALHRERVATAKQLLQTIETAPAAAPEISWWRKWFEGLRVPPLALSGALATVLLCLTAGTFWLWRERVRLNEQLVRLQQTETSAAQLRAQELSAQKQTLENELAQERQQREQMNAELERLRQQPSVPQPALLSFLLTPGATRNNTAAPPSVPRLNQNIQLLMPLEGDAHPSYQVTVQTVEGKQMLTEAASHTANRAFATFTLPARKLNRGDYVIILSGRTASGSLEEIDRFFFRLQ
jgi:hypothetical protein